MKDVKNSLIVPVQYTIGFRTDIRAFGKTKTFASYWSFLSFMKDHGIDYKEFSSFSDFKVLVNPKDINKLFS